MPLHVGAMKAEQQVGDTFEQKTKAMEANKDLLLNANVISGTNGLFLQFVPSHIAT